MAGRQQLALRVIVPPNSTGTTIAVTAIGTDGRRTALGDVRLDGLPGTDRTTSYWAQEAREPLRGAPARVAALELATAGRAWLLDAWAWNPGTPDPQTRPLPRIDAGAKAERGLVTGDYQGGLDVLNDDPEPILTVEPVTARVAEGGTLTWRLTMSAPSETPYYVITQPRAPATGTELSTTDVDPDWFFAHAYQDVEPARPLSDTYVLPYAEIPPGSTTGEITVPTAIHVVTEPDEVVELHPLNRTMPVLTGVVTGA